jgi:hypothetical protein
MFKKTEFAIILVVLATLSALAADKNGVVLRQDGTTKVVNNPVQVVARKGASSLIAIYDNIGTAYPKGSYWCCQENFFVLGPTAETNTAEYWRAAAFTPKADYTVTKVEVAVGLIEGTNGLILSINEDASGVPGKAIKTWSLSGLPAFGTCCTVETRMDAAGTPVNANTRYWLVLKTNTKDSNTFAAWNVNDVDQIDSELTATYCSDDKGGSCSANDQWTSVESLPGPAFAVMGK